MAAFMLCLAYINDWRLTNEKKNDTTYTLVKKYVTTMIQKDAEEWSPICLTFSFQPMRPYKQDVRIRDDSHHYTRPFSLIGTVHESHR